MSREAIDAIEEFIHKREAGISIAEIKLRIKEFIEYRDRFDGENPRAAWTRHYYSRAERRTFAIREGKTIMRDKLKGEE